MMLCTCRASCSSAVTHPTHERRSHSLTLSVRVNGEYMELCHVIFWVKSRTRPTSENLPIKREVDVLRLLVHNRSHVSETTSFPYRLDRRSRRRTRALPNV